MIILKDLAAILDEVPYSYQQVSFIHTINKTVSNVYNFYPRSVLNAKE